jgi:hypothetical protein
MSTTDSKHTPHEHHHSHESHDHHHHHHHTDECLHLPEIEPSHLEKRVLSPKDKLIIRLKNLINHNQDHGATYRMMADQAKELGATDAARHILEVAEQNAYQNETLESALAALDNL